MKKIKKEMTIAEVLHNHPETIEMLQENLGMCTGCPAAAMETIAMGAEHHGKDAGKLVDKLNKVIEKGAKKKSK